MIKITKFQLRPPYSSVMFTASLSFDCLILEMLKILIQRAFNGRAMCHIFILI